MTRPVALTLILWLAMAVMVARSTSLLRATSSIPEDTGIPAPQALAPEWPADSLHAWGERVMTRNPFDTHRASVMRSRRATDEDSWLEPAQGVELEPPPVLPPVAVSPSLRGIVGATGRWEAVLGDVPGQQWGVLMRRGETIGEIHMQDIGPTWVVLRLSDSTLRLTLRGAQ